MSAVAPQIDPNSLGNAVTLDDYTDVLEAMLLDTNPRKVQILINNGIPVSNIIM